MIVMVLLGGICVLFCIIVVVEMIKEEDKIEEKLFYAGGALCTFVPILVGVGISIAAIFFEYDVWTSRTLLFMVLPIIVGAILLMVATFFEEPSSSVYTGGSDSRWEKTDHYNTKGHFTGSSYTKKIDD